MRSSVSSRFKDDIIIQEHKDYKEVNMTDALRKIAGSKLIKKKKNDYTKEKDIIRGINDNIHCTSYYFLQQWCSIVYNYLK